MLRIGGHLVLFQFKAKSREKFRLEKFQWRNLKRVSSRYPRSTFYVFPEAADSKEAASVDCIIRHSWFCSAADLGTSFRGPAETTTLTLDTSVPALLKSRPRSSIPIESACQVFGCFCPPVFSAAFFPTRSAKHAVLFFSNKARLSVSADRPIMRTPERIFGIPVGDVSERAADLAPITSVGDFEQMLGDEAESNLAPGLYGLFLPQAQND
ncbi:hypothetical protein LAL4801_03758 [Roseibium aggregatum]|uniref:Uncharacterized protein n=2 Tax=Roseibium aggregatum TaxID=187304 RepID=A0A0M6Y6K9_9HYPH|nr:hypothetical protein LAL4801_03758 [Roseibium aggregatum]